jgi:hypothetical protein
MVCKIITCLMNVLATVITIICTREIRSTDLRRLKPVVSSTRAHIHDAAETDWLV